MSLQEVESFEYQEGLEDTHLPTCPRCLKRDTSGVAFEAEGRHEIVCQCCGEHYAVITESDVLWSTANYIKPEGAQVSVLEYVEDLVEQPLPTCPHCRRRQTRPTAPAALYDDGDQVMVSCQFCPVLFTAVVEKTVLFSTVRPADSE